MTPTVHQCPKPRRGCGWSHEQHQLTRTAHSFPSFLASQKTSFVLTSSACLLGPFLQIRLELDDFFMRMLQIVLTTFRHTNTPNLRVRTVLFAHVRLNSFSACASTPTHFDPALWAHWHCSVFPRKENIFPDVVMIQTSAPLKSTFLFSSLCIMFISLISSARSGPQFWIPTSLLSTSSCERAFIVQVTLSLNLALGDRHSSPLHILTLLIAILSVGQCQVSRFPNIPWALAQFYLLKHILHV